MGGGGVKDHKYTLVPSEDCNQEAVKFNCRMTLSVCQSESARAHQ